MSRTELLTWLNTTLDLHLARIEETASGAVACQLVDHLHPGAINLSKVNFKAKGDYDFMCNYKVLQAAFTKLGIDKPVEVSKLIRARPLDNMEFMQWFKGYFDAHAPGRGPATAYDSRRTGSAASSLAGQPASGRSSLSGAARSPRGSRASSAMKENNQALSQQRRPEAGARSVGPKAKGVTPLPLGRAAPDADAGHLSSQLRDVTEQLDEARNRMDTAERERDFYFDKLRDIEILCQTPELHEIEIVQYFEKILYATDEAEAKDAMLEAQRACTAVSA